MALGKYTRVDNRRSSGYCSTVTIVVFVALCLVGVWMMTSSSIVPGQTIDEPPQEKKSAVKQQVTESSENNTQQFEDNQGDLPEDATKGDTAENMDQNDQNPQEKSDQESKSDDASNTEMQNGENKMENEDSRAEQGGSGREGDLQENSNENKSDSNDSEKKFNSDEGEKKSDTGDGEQKVQSDESSSGTQGGEKVEEKEDQNDNRESEGSFGDKKEDDPGKTQNANEMFPSGAQLELLNETSVQNGSWSTQASESKNEKEAQLSSKQQGGYTWKLCNVTAGPDFIPCLDNWQAIKHLRSTKHYEHRERHCPEEPPTCLVSLPEGYRRSVQWPKSREKV